MKTNLKLGLLIGALGLFSTGAMAAHLPDEIYQPRGAKVIKADRQGKGEFEVEFRLDAREHRIPVLAEKVISHAGYHGFRLVESEIEHDDADLKFKRGDQEMDIEIELKDHHRIEYKAELDLDKN